MLAKQWRNRHIFEVDILRREIISDRVESEHDSIIEINHFGGPSIVDTQIFDHEHPLFIDIEQQSIHLLKIGLMKILYFEWYFLISCAG